MYHLWQCHASYISNIGRERENHREENTNIILQISVINILEYLWILCWLRRIHFSDIC